MFKIYHVKVLKEAALGHYTHMITVGVLLTDFNMFSANRNTNVYPVRPGVYNLPSGRNQGRSGNTSQSFTLHQETNIMLMFLSQK